MQLLGILVALLCDYQLSAAVLHDCCIPGCTGCVLHSKLWQKPPACRFSMHAGCSKQCLCQSCASLVWRQMLVAGYGPQCPDVTDLLLFISILYVVLAGDHQSCACRTGEECWENDAWTPAPCRVCTRGARTRRSVWLLCSQVNI